MKYIIQKGSQYDKIGTNRAGYAAPKYGPFMCSNCRWFHGISKGTGNCSHPEVKADLEIKKEDDKPVVEAKGCCTFFKNK